MRVKSLYEEGTDSECDENKRIRYFEIYKFLNSIKSFKYKKDVRIIDFGSGQAKFASYLADKGVECDSYTALDIRYNTDEKLVNIASKNVGKLNRESSYIVHECDGFCDIIDHNILVNIHMLQDMSSLREISEMLKKFKKLCSGRITIIVRCSDMNSRIKNHQTDLFLPSISDFISTLYSSCEINSIYIKNLKKLPDNYLVSFT